MDVVTASPQAQGKGHVTQDHLTPAALQSHTTTTELRLQGKPDKQNWDLVLVFCLHGYTLSLDISYQCFIYD